MGMMTRSREFLIIKNGGLREYTMYVHARDVGSHLDCGWFLTVEPGIFKNITTGRNASEQNLSCLS
jgi:hypothetical protein